MEVEWKQNGSRIKIEWNKNGSRMKEHTFDFKFVMLLDTLNINKFLHSRIRLVVFESTHSLQEGCYFA